MNTEKTDQVTWWSENQLGWFTDISAKLYKNEFTWTTSRVRLKAVKKEQLTATSAVCSRVAFFLTASILCLNHVQTDSSPKWCKSKSNDANSQFAGLFESNILRCTITWYVLNVWVNELWRVSLGLVVSVYRAFILNAPLKKKKAMIKSYLAATVGHVHSANMQTNLFFHTCRGFRFSRFACGSVSLPFLCGSRSRWQTGEWTTLAASLGTPWRLWLGLFVCR